MQQSNVIFNLGPLILILDKTIYLWYVILCKKDWSKWRMGNETIFDHIGNGQYLIMVLLEKSGHVLYDMYHRTRKTILTGNTVSV